MFFFKKKFDKLKRQDVVNSIVELNQRESELEQAILDKNKEIADLYEKGKKEQNQQLRLFYAKKINFLKQELQADTQRIMYLLYNINLLGRLKTAIEDNDFLANVSGVNLSKLLGNQKELALFLNKSLNRKIKAEDVLTNADDIFNEVAGAYEPNERIYGVNANDDEALAIFELDDQLSMENSDYGVPSEGTKINKNKEEQ